MYNQRQRKILNINLVIPIILSIFILIGFLYFYNSGDKTNSYVNLLNFSLPFTAAHDNESSDITILDKFKTIFIDNNNGFSLVKNEISYFKQLDSSNCNESLVSNSIKPFQLDESAILKVTSDNIYDNSLKKKLDVTKPEVLIFHTHSNECYYDGSGDTQSTNSDKNVTGLGDILTKELEENYGIAVVHDKTNHTGSSYDDSYIRSNETLKRYADKYKDGFKIVLDLHRDGLPNSANKSKSTINLNGENVAQIFFVYANQSKNAPITKKLSSDLASICDNLFPNIRKKDTVYNYGKMRYNQDTFENTILIEVGSQFNSMEEATESAKIIARIFAEYLNK